MIASGTIVNEDVNASAAIAGTKISPDFGSQNVVTTGTSTAASFIPTSSGIPTNGMYLPSADNVAISTSGTGKLFVDASGNIKVPWESPRIASIFDDNYRQGFYFDATNRKLNIFSTTNDSGGDIVFKTRVGTGSSDADYGTERLYITSTGELKHIGGGSEGSPGVYFAGSAPSNSLYVQATTGNVGLGTSSPLAELHLNDETGVSRIRLTGGAAGADNFEIGQAIVGVSNSGFSIYDVDAAASRLVIDSSGNVGIGPNGAGGYDVLFNPGTSSSPLVRDSSGRLLVGTSSSRDLVGASYSLQIEGSGTSPYSGLSILNKANNAVPAYLILGKSRGGTNGVDAVSDASGGDAIGDIWFAAADGTDLASASARITCFVDGAVSGDDVPGRLVFSTTADGASSPDPRMTITNDGKLLVGTSSAESGSERFVVKGNPGGDYLASFVATNPSTAPFGIWITYTATTPNNTGNRFLTCTDATATRAEIRSNGGLANYQSNNVDLSDERTKRDITSSSSTWDCVQAWDVVNYNYLDDAAGDTARIGVIAQQIQQHCPEVVIPYQEAEDAVLDDDGNVVTPAKDERLGVREQQMMWMAIKALQEAQLRIETLEAEVAALKAS